jgi:siderophore synthetase component
MKIPTQNIQHLTKENWDKANAILLKKTLSEFAHELLIVPIKSDSNSYHIFSPDEKAVYTFKATILALNHWSIAVDSIQKTIEGKNSPLRLLEFIIEFKDTLGISESLLPTYLEEITSTLYSTAYKIANEKYTSKDLLE